MVDIDKKERAEGALLASAIGDALGWPCEFNSGNQNCRNNKESGFVAWKRKNRYPFWYVETIEKGNYSDDTQLMLAMARCLDYENWKEKFTSIEYPFWLNYERGAGRAVKKAALLWKKGVVPWKSEKYQRDYFMAGGNGGAMRILPHVIRKMKDDIESIIDDVIADVIISHGHPRAILGATCYSYALYFLINKREILSFAELVEVLIDGRKIWGAAPDKDKFFDWLAEAQTKAGYNYSLEWNNCYTDMIMFLKYIKQALSDGLLSDDKSVLKYIGAYSKSSGAGDVAILAAVYFFSKYVNTPELAISVPAFCVGIDTDTIASMTGGLIGAFCGSGWIPLEWKSVQDYSYICSVARGLCVVTEETTELLSDDIKKMKMVNSFNIKSKQFVVTITKYRAVFGQTIYIKNYNKKSVKSDLIKLNLSQIEKILNEEELKRITLRKAFDIILQKHNGMDEKDIVKKVKVDGEIVSKVLELFEQK